MRKKLNPYPVEGDIVVKTKFLLFPKEINREVRWLEKASYEEIYTMGSWNGLFYWKPNKWID